MRVNSSGFPHLEQGGRSLSMSLNLGGSIMVSTQFLSSEEGRVAKNSVYQGLPSVSMATAHVTAAVLSKQSDEPL